MRTISVILSVTLSLYDVDRPLALHQKRLRYVDADLWNQSQATRFEINRHLRGLSSYRYACHYSRQD